MLSFLKKTGLCIILVLSFIIGYGFICDSLYKNGNEFLSNGKRYWQFSIKNQDYDYVVLGSSRAYGAIDIEKLDSLTELRGVNLGLNGSGFKENYLSLKIFLLNRNKIDSLYLQTDPYSFMSSQHFTNPLHSYAYLPYRDKDKTIKDALHSSIPHLRKLPVYLPYISYFVYNNYYSPFRIVRSFVDNKFCDNKNYECGNGNKVFSKNKRHQLSVKSDTIHFSPESQDRYYYNKIIELAQKNNIKIIQFTAPSLDKFDYDFRKLTMEVTKEDLYFKSESEWTKKEKFFADQTHVNSEGRNLFTNEFASFLNNIQ